MLRTNRQRQADEQTYSNVLPTPTDRVGVGNKVANCQKATIQIMLTKINWIMNNSVFKKNTKYFNNKLHWMAWQVASPQLTLEMNKGNVKGPVSTKDCFSKSKTKIVRNVFKKKLCQHTNNIEALYLLTYYFLFLSGINSQEQTLS